MELVCLARDMLHDVAGHAASYRLGQSTLRYLDRALWTIEKCARWAVPPPLDQEDRPQPELVRPLPWVFFLALLVALRVTRESISLLNLVFGKPPLRSADVVSYIQSKRRYLRTLKYQGGRAMRARGDGAPARAARPWLGSVRSLLALTMCYRAAPHCADNSAQLGNNDEVLVVKRGKRGARETSPAPAAETTMERLIEKIMVDLDAESDEDSSYTLTNVTSIRSDQSGFNSDSEQETAVHVTTSTPNTSNSFGHNCSPTSETDATISLADDRNGPLESNDKTRSEVTQNHCGENGIGAGNKPKIEHPPKNVLTEVRKVVPIPHR